MVVHCPRGECFFGIVSLSGLFTVFWAHASQEQDEGDSGTQHYHFVQQALQPLVEMLLKLLSKQEEGQDEDDGVWNLSLAGGNCLSLVAAVVRDEVLALVMPYIQVCFSLPAIRAS